MFDDYAVLYAHLSYEKTVMVAIAYSQFTGLAPVSGAMTVTSTRATVCMNAWLSKGDIRPLRHPVQTAQLGVLGKPVLMQNPNTGAIVSGVYGDGIIPDVFNFAPLAYAVINGVGKVMLNDTEVAPFFPTTPDAAPSIRTELVAANVTEGIRSYVQSIASVDTPVNTGNVAYPDFIIHAQDLHAFLVANDWVSPDVGGFSKQDVINALNHVLDDYYVAYPHDDADRHSIRAVLLDNMRLINERLGVVRSFTGGAEAGPGAAGTQRFSYDQCKREYPIALRNAVEQLGIWLTYELTNKLPTGDGLPQKFPTCVEWLFDTFNVTAYCTVYPAPRLTYTVTDYAVYFRTKDETFYNDARASVMAVVMFAYTNYSTYGAGLFDTILDAMWEYSDACLEGSTYKWYGVGTSLLPEERGELQPFTPAPNAMNLGEDVYAKPVPRAYCYTFVDVVGRESRPSEVAVDLGINQPGKAAKHFVTLPAKPNATVQYAHLYRAITSPDAKPDDEVTWTAIAVVELTNAPQEIEAIGIDKAAYASLTTYIDESVPSTPKHLCVTETNHAVCTDDDGRVVYFSKRHKFWSFPYNRRVEMPHAVEIVGIKTSGNVVYVATNKAPVVIVIGEDKNDEGLQLDDTYLAHAPYPCLHVGSLASTPWGVMYWSSVGLLAIAGVNVLVATSTLIDLDQVPDYVADTSAYYEGMYFGWRDGVCTMIDTPDPTFGNQPIAPMTQAEIPANAACIGVDGNMYLMQPSSPVVKRWSWRDGVPLPIKYQTFTQVLPMNAVFTAVKLVGVGIVGRLYGLDENGVEQWSVLVSANRMVRVPARRFNTAIAVRFEGVCEVLRQIDVATSPEEIAGV